MKEYVPYGTLLLAIYTNSCTCTCIVDLERCIKHGLISLASE